MAFTERGLHEAAYVQRETAVDLTELSRLSATTRRTGQSDFVGEVIALFLAHAPDNYAVARSAFKYGDSQSLARAVHKLKSQAAYFGARRLVHVCKELERLGYRNELKRCESLLDDLEDELDRVVAALERHRRAER